MLIQDIARSECIPMLKTKLPSKFYPPTFAIRSCLFGSKVSGNISKVDEQDLQPEVLTGPSRPTNSTNLTWPKYKNLD